VNASEKVLTFDYFQPTTPKLSPAIPELGAGSIVTSANDYLRWMIFLLSHGNATLATMESGQMIVPNNWASTFMMLNQDAPGNALAAGYGFDVVGRTFYNQRFFTKGGDTLYHKTRTGFLPELDLGVSVMANLEGDMVTEIYVDGIRNALLQLYRGDTDDQVQAAWQVLKDLIEQTRKQLPSVLPNNTLVLPLKDGTLTLNYRAYVSWEDQVMITAKCDSLGLPPLHPASQFLGTFQNSYYGTATVKLQGDGLLSLTYGTFTGTLCRLSTSVGESESFLWPNGTMLSGLFTTQYFPTEFSNLSGGLMQKVNVAGMEFDRNAVLARMAPIKRPSAFVPSPFLF